jgi:hypothetical protein
MRHRRWVVLSTACILAAACGSTVQVRTGVGQAGLPDGTGAGDLASGAAGGDGPATTAPREGSNAGGPGGTGGNAVGESRSSLPGTSSTGSDPQSRGGSLARPANVPGVTDTTVKLGVEYFDTAQLGTFANSAGVKGVGATSQLQTYQVAADYVNRHGGLAGGRKLVIVPRQRSTTESTSSAGQASCAAFAEDDRVFAANADLTEDSPLVACLAKHGVLSVTGGQVEAGSRDDFAHYPGLYMGPSTMETVGAAGAYVDALVRQGLLTPGSTIGLLWFDFSDFVVARQAGLLPALARHGLKVKTEFRSHYGGSASDLGAIASQMQSAELQFRAAGVDRVLSLDFQGTLLFFFMQQAQQQGYHPRYGLASWSDLDFLTANGMGPQLTGATGIGWLPAYDVDAQHQPKTAPMTQCLALMRAHGMSVTAQGDLILQYDACAKVFFLKALLDKARDLRPAGLRAALAQLGQQPSYAGFGDRFDTNRPWGAAVYRDLGYDAACSCGTYRGGDSRFS